MGNVVSIECSQGFRISSDIVLKELRSQKDKLSDYVSWWLNEHRV